MTWADAGLVLLTAHLLGDFVVGQERETWNRRVRSWRSEVAHALVHGGLVLLLFGDLNAWPAATVMAGSHLAIDAVEARAGRPSLGRFLVDLAAHLTVLIALLAFLPTSGWGLWGSILGEVYGQLLALTTGAVLAVIIGGEVVGWLVQPFAQQLPEREDRPTGAGGDRSDEPARGFPQGGRTIGYLERALIFLLVLVGEAGAVGFLVAAKSIFRFGELRERSNRVEAEYILIGTLASFLWGLATAYLTLLALGRLP